MSEQLLTPGVAVDTSVQLVPGLKVPVELLAKLTVPVGKESVPDVCVTVAVQLVEELSNTLAGEQATDVEVGFTVTPTGRLYVPELPVWTESPA